jgi:hypothetical protein
MTLVWESWTAVCRVSFQPARSQRAPSTLPSTAHASSRPTPDAERQASAPRLGQIRRREDLAVETELRFGGRP